MDRHRKWRWSKTLCYTVIGIVLIMFWIVIAKITVMACSYATSKAYAVGNSARELVLVTLNAEATPKWTPEPKESLEAIIVKEAVAQNIDPALIRAMIRVESRGNISAVGFNPRLEPQYGKMGAADHSFMQVSGRWVGHDKICPEASTWTDLYNPAVNIKCGIRILKESLRIAPTPMDALSVYNSGEINSIAGQAHATKIAIELVNSMDFKRKK